MKNNKGITLVALVITIIVLLILAGVSISLVVGENGVLSRATGAAEKSKRSQMKEAMDLALEDCQTEFIDYKYAGDEDDDTVLTDMRKAISPIRVATALAKNNYKLYKTDGTTEIKPLAENETVADGHDEWGTMDTENKKKQNDEIIYFVGTGKDRLGVKVKLVEGTDGFPQISTSYAKELGKDKATKDDDFEGYTKIERGEGS